MIEGFHQGVVCWAIWGAHYCFSWGGGRCFSSQWLFFFHGAFSLAWTPVLFAVWSVLRGSAVPGIQGDLGWWLRIVTGEFYPLLGVPGKEHCEGRQQRALLLLLLCLRPSGGVAWIRQTCLVNLPLCRGEQGTWGWVTDVQRRQGCQAWFHS